MATDPAFAHADFLARLQRLDPSAAGLADAAIPPLLSATSDPAAPWRLSDSGQWLLQLLQARQALLQAAHATTLSADALRRDQKFAPPGRPSLHLVQLRQQQAAAQQATRRAKQDFAQAAAGFVRSAGLSPPARLGLSDFLQGWIDRYVP
ncbi:hypothetical protein A6R71_13595 [Xanthomonas translucens pv. arrhenatheri]|uniref:Uncharacterized protein n=1 Tax=Xanthomonas graminis pv. arrhenatheri LMG 727 TaxID=1195923 RepID=A0A0K2ZKF9_9XANT|nr:hypothetical protein [Xanthomonas translucens]OAX63904.1 hypothetical protein A6R71_13595 [Xanthomonas translucens pv. arrhenatheri]UKE78770.1 hypothetical protein KM317_05960 [Xanthomonas translucens pv. arrhenatheri]CTP86093.1 hypothetical protein XTALMG727_1555 [Xanthomonas translucens pv. arrhenatheri LMG 727]